MEKKYIVLKVRTELIVEDKQELENLNTKLKKFDFGKYSYKKMTAE